jgi:hypothetical protein|tara:strand:+ start:1021 stop:1134 length:114 start_codon:yes stop_codon:yes gene_type:complete
MQAGRQREREKRKGRGHDMRKRGGSMHDEITCGVNWA